MNDRPNDIKRIRPEIPKARVNNQMSDEERFQNITLRPVVKLQNPLLIEMFRNYISKRKNVFYNLSLEKRLDYVENAVNKDMKFRNSLKGMIIGQFTVEEYLIYIQNSSALNKRMANLIRERLISQIQLFDNPSDILIKAS
ncbi:MAG: glyoxalase [Dokdonia donghaensis]|nr:glyoxalase [Dokdonia donghaensis]